MVCLTAHGRIVRQKQSERTSRINDLKEYQKPLTVTDRSISGTSVESLASRVQAGDLSPKSILLASGKQASKAQAECNAVTEVMIQEAEQSWATKTKGKLAGIPVSLKDTVGVKGYDSSTGYSKFSNDPITEDAAIVRMIKDAGGYPYVKTNIPMTLSSFESYNDIWGITDNPHKSGYTSGGSSGGESALIAAGGSWIGVGTDVAGSVRVPAHFAGIYSLRPTTTRFPKSGGHTSMPGQEGIPSVAGPMARTLQDLTYFFRTIIEMEPWEYDAQVTERPWIEPKLPQQLTFGVIRSDGIVDPSPACARALELSVDALKKAGHKVIPFEVPDALDASNIGAQLSCSDGIETATSGMYFGETNDYGVDRAYKWAHLPWIIRWAWSFVVEHWYGDKIWATLLRDFHKQSINNRWRLVARREEYREKFFRAFKQSGVDFSSTVPNATPALPHYGLYNSFSSCLYTFLFNIVDYPAGVLPVTKVDKTKDQSPSDFSLKKSNGVAKGAYMNYDAEKMDGSPVGVEVVGRKFRDEQVLAAMQVLESALHKNGTVYEQLKI